MPARRESVAVTDAYRAGLLAVRHRAAIVARAGFARIARDDLDRSYQVWQEAATATLGATKRQGVLLSQRYLTAYLASELARREPVAPIDAERYATVDRSGRPLRDALTPPLYTVKVRLAQGADWPVALAAGAARMTRTMVGEAMAAPRFALSDLMTGTDRVVGWQRVASVDACGACLAAATGAVRADDDVPEAHDACRCVAEPVVRGVRERVRRPTGEEIFAAKTASEQNTLFGAEKAALIRDGQVPFAALLERSPRATQADGITEAPLAALQAET